MELIIHVMRAHFGTVFEKYNQIRLRISNNETTLLSIQSLKSKTFHLPPVLPSLRHLVLDARKCLPIYVLKKKKSTLFEYSEGVNINYKAVSTGRS